MSNNDNSFNFGAGLLVGILGGIAAGILLAPKSGKEMREDLKKTFAEVAENIKPDMEEAKKQALTSIDMIKYKLEKQYNHINNSIKAKNMAKAKHMETDEYDFN